jgi:hypothetical protein
MKRLLLSIVVFLIATSGSLSHANIIVAGRRGVTAANLELGQTLVGSLSGTTNYGRRNLLSVPASGILVTHGYFYGCTEDGGADGTFELAIFNSGGAQVGSCSQAGNVVDGSVQTWNETTWSVPIWLPQGMYSLQVYHSEPMRHSYESSVLDDSWYSPSDVACGVRSTNASSHLSTLTVANYDAHDDESSTSDEFYVAQTATGDGSGSSELNYMSVAVHNASTFDPGTIIHLRGEITSEVAPPSSGSAEGGYITYDGKSGSYDAWGEGSDGQAVINRGSQASGVTGIALYDSSYGAYGGKDYIIIQDLEIKEAGNATYMAAGSDHIIVRRTFMHDLGGKGFYATTYPGSGGCSYLIFGGAEGDGNVVKDCGTGTADADVLISTAHDWIVSYNHLYATKNDGLVTDRGTDGIVPVNGAYSGLIEFNSVHSHNDSYGADAFGEDCFDMKDDTGLNPSHDVIFRFNHCSDHIHQSDIQVQGESYNVVIYGNKAEGSEWGGIYLNESTDPVPEPVNHVWAWANVIADQEQGGIVLNYRSGGTMENIYLWNNTVANCGNNPVSSANTNFSVPAYWPGSPTVLKNNIFYKGRPLDTNELQLHINAGSVTQDYNLYRWPGETSYSRVAGSYLPSSTFESNEVIADSETVFEDADNDNYALTVESPAIGAGTDMSLEVTLPTISVWGVNYNFNSKFLLDPETEFVEGQIPVIVPAEQGAAWDVGAYAYNVQYFVAQSSAGSGDGTSYEDRASVSYHNAGTGVFADLDGDTVYMCGTISSSIVPPDSGSSGNVITYRGDYAPDPFVGTHQSVGYPYQHQWVLNNKSYITLYNASTQAVMDAQMTVGCACTNDDCLTYPYSSCSGESIDSNTTSGHAIIDVSDSSHITIDNWKFQNGRSGVEGSDVEDLTVTRCHFYQLAQSGVALYHADRTVIGGSEANGNTFEKVVFKTKNVWPFNPQGGNIYIVYDDGEICTDTIVSYNHIFGTTGNSFDGWGGTGLKAYSNTRLMVEYNTIEEQGAMMIRGGIHLKNMQQNIAIQDNIVRFNHIKNGPKSGDWGYGSHPAINLTRHHDGTYVYGNKIEDYESGIKIAVSEADNTECKDGIPAKDVFIWANDISDTTFYGLWMHYGISTCTNDMFDIHAWNNSVYKTTQYYDGHPLIDIPYPTAFTASPIENAFDDGTYTGDMLSCVNSIFMNGRYGQTIHHQMGSDWRDLPDGVGGTIFDDGTWLKLEDNLWYDVDEASDIGVYFRNESFCHTAACMVTNKLTNDIPDSWFTNATIDNPDFTDAPAGDLTLTATSPAIDNGVEITTILPDVSFSFYSASLLEFDPNMIMHPTNTDWSSHPPVVELVDNSMYGSGYEQGAYIYE